MEQIQRKSRRGEEADTNSQPVAQASIQSTKAGRSTPWHEPGHGSTRQGKDSSEEDLSKDRVVDHRQRPHKRKSLLRPKSSKFARTGAGKGVSISVTSRDEVSDNESPATEELGLHRTETGTRHSRPVKRTRAASGSKDVAPSELIRSDTEPSNNAHDVPAFKILEQSPPCFSPQGPGDTWTCEVDGCNYKVYQARNPYSQRMINEHLTGHNFGARDKLDLVLQEERPHLPIRSEYETLYMKLVLTFSSNLIRRIHRIASTHSSNDPITMDSFPERIQRRY